MIIQIIFTDGRIDLLAKAVESAERNLQCQFGVRKIINDEPKVADILKRTYEPRGYQVFNNAKRLGFCGTIQGAWDNLPAGTEWIWHCEDDFTYNEPIPVMDMISALKANPYLAQMALVRQPVNIHEREAGGIFKVHPDWFTEKASNGWTWVENNFCMTTNPSVYPAAIANNPYGNEAEAIISRRLRENGYLFGYWGSLNQDPKVTHIGERRSPGAFYR